MSDMHRPFL